MIVQYLSSKDVSWGKAPDPNFVVGVCGEATNTNNKKSFVGDEVPHAPSLRM